MATFSIEIRELIETFGENEVISWFEDYELTDYLTSDEIDIIESKLDYQMNKKY